MVVDMLIIAYFMSMSTALDSNRPSTDKGLQALQYDVE